MKISSKTKYAIKVVEFLADKETARGKEITEFLEVSAPYFEQISAILIKEGFIKTKRGCRGGYSLAKDVESRTMWDLIQAFNSRSWDAEGSVLDVLRDKFIAVAQETKLLNA